MKDAAAADDRGLSRESKILDALEKTGWGPGESGEDYRAHAAADRLQDQKIQPPPRPLIRPLHPGKADMVQSLSNAMMRTIWKIHGKAGAKRLKASLIASIIGYYWFLKTSPFVSSTVALASSSWDGLAVSQHRCFSAHTPRLSGDPIAALRLTQ
ncbi:MAG: hypothetical protein MZV70_13365 [Desulfobacterales bacterium]|nr:hypothetical protein [Desulfobacterales bacterium]